MRKSTSGFTIVEIAVVVVIISVLVTLVFIGYGRTQASARDSVRSSRTSTLAGALEKYYDKNGEYPSCTTMTQAGSAVSGSVLQGIDPATLLTPKSAPTDTNSITCADLTNPSGSDVFAYVGDGTSNCSLGASCYSWTLKYIDEATGTIKTINSRRNSATVAAVAGAPTLSVTTAGFTQLNASWSSIGGATSYTLEQATNAAFTTGVVDTTVGVLSSSPSSLAANTTYYYRVRAIIGGSPGPWSSTQVAATWGLTTPSVSAVANSPTTFTSSWPAVAHATSYNVQCSYDNTTWGAGCAGSTAATSYGWGPTGQGTLIYFRTQAVNGAYTSNWSDSVSALSPIDAPAPYSISSYNSLAGGWNWLHSTSNAVCPAGTTPSYDWYVNNNGTSWFWVSGSQYQSVGYSLTWGDNVHLSVASRCTTAATSSGFVWANNTGDMSLPWSTVWVGGIAERTMGWGGTCPAYTTSYSYDWFVMASRGGWSAGANGVQYTTYARTNIAWGDGDIRVRLHCLGPWGGDAYSDGWYSYGYGCLPPPQTSWCTY